MQPAELLSAGLFENLFDNNKTKLSLVDINTSSCNVGFSFFIIEYFGFALDGKGFQIYDI